LSLPRDAILPWALPLAGLSDTRFVHPPGLDTGYADHQSPAAADHFGEQAYPLMGLGDSQRPLPLDL
jgi:hypothetical protein